MFWKTPASQPARLTQEGIIVQKDDRHVPGLQTAEEIREMRGVACSHVNVRISEPNVDVQGETLLAAQLRCHPKAVPHQHRMREANFPGFFDLAKPLASRAFDLLPCRGGGVDHEGAAIRHDRFESYACFRPLPQFACQGIGILTRAYPFFDEFLRDVFDSNDFVDRHRRYPPHFVYRNHHGRWMPAVYQRATKVRFLEKSTASFLRSQFCPALEVDLRISPWFEVQHWWTVTANGKAQGRLERAAPLWGRVMPIGHEVLEPLAVEIAQVEAVRMVVDHRDVANPISRHLDTSHKLPHPTVRSSPQFQRVSGSDTSQAALPEASR